MYYNFFVEWAGNVVFVELCWGTSLMALVESKRTRVVLFHCQKRVPILQVLISDTPVRSVRLTQDRSVLQSNGRSMLGRLVVVQEREVTVYSLRGKQPTQWDTLHTAPNHEGLCEGPFTLAAIFVLPH